MLVVVVGCVGCVERWGGLEEIRETGLVHE